MGSTDDRQLDLTSNPGVITATLLSGVIAVAVAAAEWVGSGRPLGSPAGTVTFLFTDIEGSTRLLQDLGDRYGAVRDEHAAILRRAIRDGGVEVSTEGDSFFAAFASPVGAVRAAVDAQRSTLQLATTNERPLSGSAYRREVLSVRFSFATWVGLGHTAGTGRPSRAAPMSRVQVVTVAYCGRPVGR